MAMAVPVVASRVSGIPELVHDGVNGLLVEPDDVVALADAITRLIDTPELGRQLGQAARASVTEQFDNDRNLSLLIQQLEACHEPATHAAERAAAV
jgi:glycosyltransferase involved in cell wall biosynthesis